MTLLDNGVDGVFISSKQTTKGASRIQFPDAKLDCMIRLLWNCRVAI